MYAETTLSGATHIHGKANPWRDAISCICYLYFLQTSIVHAQYHTYEVWFIVYLKRNNYTLK